MSPGGREMATSGGEREEHQAWTHDNRDTESHYGEGHKISVTCLKYSTNHNALDS